MQFRNMVLAAGAILLPLEAGAEVHDHFNSAMAALPAHIWQSSEPAVFVNLHALSTVFGTTDFTPSQANRAMLALSLPALQAMGMAEGATFEKKAGFAPYEVNFLAGHGAEPDLAVIWGGDRDFPAGLKNKLPDLGFTPVAGSPDLFANGAMGQMNLSALDKQNPWISSSGAASLVQTSPTVVYQAFSEEALRAITAQPSAYDTPEGRGFSSLQPEGETYVMQAVLFSKAFGQAAGEAAAGFVPAYDAGLLADIQAAEGAITLLALSYKDCDVANQALLTPWPQAAGGVQSGTAAFEEGCLALWHAPGGQDLALNTSFKLAWEAILQRQFAPVAVAR